MSESRMRTWHCVPSVRTGLQKRMNTIQEHSVFYECYRVVQAVCVTWPVTCRVWHSVIWTGTLCLPWTSRLVSLYRAHRYDFGSTEVAVEESDRLATLPAPGAPGGSSGRFLAPGGPLWGRSLSGHPTPFGLFDEEPQLRPSVFPRPCSPLSHSPLVEANRITLHDLARGEVPLARLQSARVNVEPNVYRDILTAWGEYVKRFYRCKLALREDNNIGLVWPVICRAPFFKGRGLSSLQPIRTFKKNFINNPKTSIHHNTP